MLEVLAWIPYGHCHYGAAFACSLIGFPGFLLLPDLLDTLVSAFVVGEPERIDHVELLDAGAVPRVRLALRSSRGLKCTLFRLKESAVACCVL